MGGCQLIRQELGLDGRNKRFGRCHDLGRIRDVDRIPLVIGNQSYLLGAIERTSKFDGDNAGFHQIQTKR